MTHADNAVVSWDSEEKRWVVRVQVGAEVIRRPFKYTRHEVDSEVLRSVAVHMVQDEGYELAEAEVVVTR